MISNRAMKVFPASVLSVLAAICLMAPAGSASAQGTEGVDELLKKRACAGCHLPDRKLVGPSFKDIAAKHGGGGSDARALLVEHVRKGSSGSWGPIPMPPNPALTEDEAKLLVDWVLTQ